MTAAEVTDLARAEGAIAGRELEEAKAEGGQVAGAGS